MSNNNTLTNYEQVIAILNKIDARKSELTQQQAKEITFGSSEITINLLETIPSDTLQLPITGGKIAQITVVSTD
jgi:hypothetical protein